MLDQELRAEELQRLLDMSRELLVIFELDGGIRYLSPAWDLVLGRDRSELDTANIGALVHPEDRARLGPEIQDKIAAGQDRGEFVVRMSHRDGTERRIDWTWRLDKPSSLFLALGRDVTSEYEARHDLEGAEGRIQSLIGRMADPSMGIDRDGRLVYLNDAAVERFGRPRADLIGQSLWDDFPIRGSRFEKEYRGALSDGEPRLFEEFNAETGRWVEVRAIPDAEGLGITYRDVTERHDLESQFRQSQKMEAIGRLAGGVAHDFNNLLTAIMGYAEILDHDGLADTDRVSVAAIRRAADRAAILTRQLLAFGRRQIFDFRVLDADEVVAGIGSLFDRLVGENVALQITTSPEPARIKADASQLEQILVNLVVNARDAMPDGGTISIEVAPVELDETYARTHAEVTPGPHVMIAVSDTGVGMSPEVQAQVFEPFYTTKPAGLGTGLGLSTVFGIVKQSGGSIGVYSEEGHGSVFKVYLPRVFVAADQPDVREPASMNLEGNETVLLAEDDEAVREITIMALRRHGYEVLVATSGEEAIGLAADHPGPIHLLVTDIVMRGMTGRELSEALVLERPLVRTLYVSGYTENTIVHHGVLEPGIAFLAKPFTPIGLARRVREVLAT
jgi:PAS domain S-box-containing protein